MTNATLEYPDWYIRNYNFRIGYHVVIDRELWRVVNRNPIFPHEKNPGSTWLLPANTEIAKESISDYYEAGKNTLYTLLFGFYADRLTQIKIFKPGATLEWFEFLEMATGESLNPKYFVDRFVK